MSPDLGFLIFSGFFGLIYILGALEEVMKIEWLDAPQYTRAKITQGWISKRCAIVRYIGGRTWAFERADGSQENRMQTPHVLDREVSDAREQIIKESVRDGVWRPVSKLPKAKLLKG